MYLFKTNGNKYAKYKCTPAELYRDIIALGYDWKILFNTRPHWVFIKDENKELPFLSTLDLLKMRIGEYVPYWLNSKYIKTTTGFLKETLSAIPVNNLRD
jgi:hypothetical protein